MTRVTVKDGKRKQFEEEQIFSNAIEAAHVPTVTFPADGPFMLM